MKTAVNFLIFSIEVGAISFNYRLESKINSIC